MANRKFKRYDEGGEVDDMYSDYGPKSGRGSAGTSEASSEIESERGAPGTSETIKPSKSMASSEAEKPKATKSEKSSSVSIMKQKPVATADTFNAYGLNNFAKPKAKEEEAPKSTFKKNATSASSGRNPGKDKEKTEPSSYKKNATYAPSGRSAGKSSSSMGNTVDFAGSGLGMKRGGSVSSASRRADGIATKGKTRGKMC